MLCSFDTAELGFSIQSNETLTVTDKIHLIRTPKFLDITSTTYKIQTMRFNMVYDLDVTRVLHVKFK